MRQSRLANRIEGRRQGFKERKLIMNKTIKMLVAGMSAAVLAIVLIACGGQKQGTGADVAPETSVETEVDPSATVGGWTLPSAISSTLTAEEQAIFDNRVKITDLISKVSPMLGLMGTLIPLGPGIQALGNADTSALSPAPRSGRCRTSCSWSVRSIAAPS